MYFLTEDFAIDQRLHGDDSLAFVLMAIVEYVVLYVFCVRFVTLASWLRMLELISCRRTCLMVR